PRDIQIDMRVKLKAEHPDHSVKTVYRRDVDSDIRKQIGDEPVIPEHDDPRISTDKRRRQQGQNDQHIEKTFKRYIKAGHNISYRNADTAGKKCRSCRNDKTVQQGRVIIFIRKELFVVFEG